MSIRSGSPESEDPLGELEERERVVLCIPIDGAWQFGELARYAHAITLVVERYFLDVDIVDAELTREFDYTTTVPLYSAEIRGHLTESPIFHGSAGHETQALPDSNGAIWI